MWDHLPPRNSAKLPIGHFVEVRRDHLAVWVPCLVNWNFPSWKDLEGTAMYMNLDVQQERGAAKTVSFKMVCVNNILKSKCTLYISKVRRSG